jgi:hypothetical protein
VSLTLVTFVVLSAGGCQPEVIRVPTIAGVVQAIEPDAQGARYVLNTGEVVLNQGRDKELHPPGAGTPRVGDLLVVGSDSEGTWYVLIAGSSTGQGRCFAFRVNGVDRGDSIDTSIGVRFPKTADFDPGPDTDGNYNEQPHGFCVNDRGEIFAWV